MAETKDKNIVKSLICPYCGDTFTRDNIYKRHVESCDEKGEVDENGKTPEPFSDPSAAIKIPVDPAKMTEIERLEHELNQKKAEARAKVAEEASKIEKNRQELETKGLHVEPTTAGKYRQLIIQNHDNIAGLFNEQDTEGYDHLCSFLTSTGLIFAIFKKR